MHPRRRLALLLLLLLLAVALAVWQFTRKAGVTALVPVLPVTVDELLVKTEVFASDLPEITDLQFVLWPDGAAKRRIVLVVHKGGSVTWLDLQSKTRGQLLQHEVLTDSEMGLLGLAVSPHFPTDLRMYSNAVVATPQAPGRQTELRQWTLPATWQDLQAGKQAEPGLVVLIVPQPYGNHNGGQLQFGPDHYLYVGLGDGGAGGDPHKNGQNPQSLLGKMLRLDVLQPPAGKPYGVPPDNPFVHNTQSLPEIWALGLRNPWRYNFAADGALWLADVGQDAVEEVNVVTAGANLGWNRQEGHTCFAADTCDKSGLTQPRYAHGHDTGVSITGGFVYHGQQIPALRGRYVFCDFLVPWIRALTTETMAGAIARQDGWPGRATAVGSHDGLCSTMGQDPDGELWIGDFRGRLLRIVANQP